tara:strand:+ start:969 stop:1178 length:210 start_codon:yes stop_codon:yes gene_type:complete
MTNLHIEPKSPNQLLSRRQASEYLGVKENTLAIWACNKRYGLPVIKVGRLCKYRLSDLDKFLDDRTCAN